MTIAEMQSFLVDIIEGTIFAGNTYIVGGAVRDHLLKIRNIYDFDICVELPNGGIKLGKRIRGQVPFFSSNRVNHRFGTVRLSYGDFLLDLSDTRKERYKKKSRFPIISYGDLLEDTFRRDFTINAMQIEVFSGNIIDLSGLGESDLEAGLIRTLREPHTVLKEDPLRILRAVRFATRFDFAFTEELDLALRECAPLLKKVSFERARSELLLLRHRGHYSKAMAIFEEYGMLPHLKAR